MIFEARDPEVIGGIRPRDVASYLRARGWTAIDQEEGRFTIWAPNGAAPPEAEAEPDRDADVQIVLPVSVEFRDYALRVGEALKVLSEREGRTVDSLVADIQHAMADVVRVRLGGAEAASGEVPLTDGASLISGAKDLMFAAACAAVQKRSYFHTRRPPEAVDYMRDRVRLGQTERGSFVVTLISPLPLAAAQAPLDAELFEELDPFERRVTTTLQSALTSAAAAAENALITGDFEPFEQGVEAGVSANLCAAIAATAEEAHGATVGVEVSWAIARPQEHPQGEVRFSQDAVEVVGEAAKVLRRAGPFEDHQVFGPVERLERQEGEETGTISIATLVLDHPARVRVTLDDRQYAKAIHAHDAQVPVIVTGTLVRAGRQWELQDPGSISVLEPGDDDAAGPQV